MKRAFLILLTVLAGLPSCSDRSFQKPNFVIILADDLGYGDLGCYGNPGISTPNIDRMAVNGLVFTDFHSNGPVCTPTRAALLTGCYQQRCGLEGVIPLRGVSRQYGLDTGYVKFPGLLRNKGYATGIMGKWHLGYRPEFNPVNQGFDEFHGYLGGNIDYHSHHDLSGSHDWWYNLDPVHEEGYLTDLITRHSVGFIRANKNRPFLLYIAHGAPHAPYQGRKDPAYRFPDRQFSYEGPVEDKDRAYREMVEAMDEGIGEVMDALQEMRLEENTLVFFFSDNGAYHEYGSNGRLHGAKGTLWEGGHRVPAIARWPGKIDPGWTNQAATGFDLAPTILSISKMKPSGHMPSDGTDLSPLLFKGKSLPERYLFWRYRYQKAVRHQQWKLLINNKDTLLFDLEHDLEEIHDLSGARPELVREMSRQLGRWEQDAGLDSDLLTR